MPLFDSHCHLDVDAFDGPDGVDAAVQRARDAHAAAGAVAPPLRREALALEQRDVALRHDVRADLRHHG